MVGSKGSDIVVGSHGALVVNQWTCKVSNSSVVAGQIGQVVRACSSHCGIVVSSSKMMEPRPPKQRDLESIYT